MGWISCKTCKYSYSAWTTAAQVIFACSMTYGMDCIDREYQYYKPKEKVEMEWPMKEFIKKDEMVI
jgi:hypothetical protein